MLQVSHPFCHPGLNPGLQLWLWDDLLHGQGLSVEGICLITAGERHTRNNVIVMSTYYSLNILTVPENTVYVSLTKYEDIKYTEHCSDKPSAPNKTNSVFVLCCLFLVFLLTSTALCVSLSFVTLSAEDHTLGQNVFYNWYHFLLGLFLGLFFLFLFSCFVVLCHKQDW